ncbi:3-oxoacyl-ACP reductase FabG [Arsenophonus symbiont of Ornithomya chloropus]|uniref:3-oxoacyl-ACP reductase FabG n=1 Tax=Arsenophonus symbiont of Ornithomya chloropus TaxID=634121 RepID=UPI0032B18381
MIFNEKIALVTGASRGIGRATAELLVQHGARVIGTSTKKIGSDLINSYLSNKGKGYILNVTDTQCMHNTLSNIYEEFGKIDILINNAGIRSDDLLIRMKEEEWNKVIHTNLTSIFNLSKIIIRSMIKQRYGRIISIGSVVGTMGNVGQTNYAAAKAGIIAFSKSLAREVASRGITVNVVSPGFVETDMTQALKGKKRTEILSTIPIGRFADPKEIANAVIFLASDKAAYITGETLHVNGGMYMI